MSDFTVNELLLPLEATTEDPFIADLEPEDRTRLDALRAQVSARPRRRIYD